MTQATVLEHPLEVAERVTPPTDDVNHEKPPDVAEQRHVETTNPSIWTEVAAVIAIAVLPMLFSAASKVIWPEIAIQKPFSYTGWYMICRGVWISLPILFLMRLRGEPWSAFGLSRCRPVQDIPAAAVIWLLGWGTCVLFWKAFWVLSPAGVGLGQNGTAAVLSRPEGVVGFSLLIAGSLANGFTEELAFRGYLLSRLEGLIGTTTGLYVTIGLFSAVHVYQGLGGILSTALLGLVYGASFLWLRRLWPVALAHAVADVVGFAMLPG